MNSTIAPSEIDRTPLTFLLAKWWGYALATVYVLYGGVKIILSVLDRNYTDILTPIISVSLGLALLIVAYGFRDRKQFGWYGEVALNSLVVLISLFSLKQFGAVVVLILAGVALILLFIPSTRSCFQSAR